MIIVFQEHFIICRLAKVCIILIMSISTIDEDVIKKIDIDMMSSVDDDFAEF
jgi:hypothetical protein